ncbi:hypothetical protein [Kocuria aegyptia]|uniref:Uncharacterized protein n=1 Tax=Kocuria aegyptia TaxID=330943 RepID=A0ABP4WHH7_9MICC
MLRARVGWFLAGVDAPGLQRTLRAFMIGSIMNKLLPSAIVARAAIGAEQ